MGGKRKHSKHRHSPSESDATVHESGSLRELQSAQTTQACGRRAVSDARPTRVPHTPRQLLGLLLPWNLIAFINFILYTLIQDVIGAIFAPRRPPKGAKLANPRGRVAIVGAGLSGLASAAHLIGHGFDVEIFEEKSHIGGIWADVNSTSGLQLHSILYRFFPDVRWSEAYPKRDEILGEIAKLVEEYDLESRLHLGTKVTSAKKDPATSGDPHKLRHARWIINDDAENIFDAIIVTIGTCGAPKRQEFGGEEDFTNAGGKIIHSSELDDHDFTDKNVVVIGSGASGVEAVELAVSKQAAYTSIIARTDKWIIPRQWIVGSTLALQPFGRQTWLTWIPQGLLRHLFYRDLKDLSPKDRGIYEGTPIVNSEFLKHIRQGKAEYMRADTLGFTSSGVKVNKRTRDQKPGDDGEEDVIEADIVVLATGFERPSVDFLPPSLFPDSENGPYTRPNLYLSNFSTADWSVLLTNSAYVDAIGTAGHVHIGIYARILMLFLSDTSTRPLPGDMKLFVDFIRWFKRSAAKQLDFYTYAELMAWIVGFLAFKPTTRARHALFVLAGIGMPPTYEIST